MTTAGDSRETASDVVVDAHLHLMTAPMLRRLQTRQVSMREEARRRLRFPGPTLEERIGALEGISVEEHAARWLRAFDAAGVREGVFIAVGEANEEVAAFVACNPGRMHAVGSLADPRHPDSARVVGGFRSLGLCGLKLYPPTQRFLPTDRALYPIYEACAEQDLPVMFHFGVTIAPYYDLSYADPLPVSAASRDFPEVTFVIVHFGAGFLRETMFLAYHTDNICVDTSGTNNWRLFHPGEPSLEEIFRDALRAFGPERVIFGTDSTAPDTYRTNILREQTEILDRLELEPAARAAILQGNARRVFRLASGQEAAG